MISDWIQPETTTLVDDTLAEGYVHCRRERTGGGVEVLLRFQGAEESAKFVSANMLALVDRSHAGEAISRADYTRLSGLVCWQCHGWGKSGTSSS